MRKNHKPYNMITFYNPAVKKAIAAAYRKGEVASVLAKKFNLGETTILRIVGKAGVVRTPAESKGVTVKLVEKVKRLYSTGLTLEETSKKSKASYSTTYRIIERAGLMRRKKVLSEETKIRAVALYLEGKNTYEVAKELGIDQGTVHSLVKKKGVARTASEAQAIRQTLNRGTYRGVTATYFSKKMGAFIFTCSTYELAHVLQLENDPNIISYERCVDRILYQKNHRYVPDFKILHSSLGVCVHEVKPLYKLREPKTQAKAKAAIQFYTPQNIVYKFITEKDIGIAGFNRIKVKQVATSKRQRKRLEGAVGQVCYSLAQEGACL